MATNPFGRYSEILTTIVTGFIIVVAVLVHVLPLESGLDSQFIDAAAWIALGAIFGKMSAVNGYANMAVQAHRRLDAIGAPPANDGNTPAPSTDTTTTTTGS